MNFRLAKKLAITSLVLGLFLAPSALYAADLEITEISYNPEGSDADYEWIEIHNKTGSSIDLSEWSFYENETDHNLTNTGDGLTISAGGYGVIARSPSAFSTRHSVPLLFGSSFSLVNSGEKIGLTTPSGSVVASASFTPAEGADGDGNSLQLISGTWQASSPTPGEANVEDGDAGTQDDDSDNSGSSGRSAPGAPMEPREEYAERQLEDVSVSAGSNVEGWVGISVELSGEVEGVDAGDFAASWLLGNGDELSGTSTSYTYQYPGEYVATFSVTTDEGTFSDQIVVDVIKPKLRLEAQSGQDGFVKVHNETGRRFNLSKWRLTSGEKEFVLPEHSTALAHGEVIVPHRVSGFFSSSAALYRPDGTLATSTESAQASNHYSGFGTTNLGNSTVVQTAHAETEESGMQKDATSSTASSTGLVLGTSTSAVGTTNRLSVFAQWGAMLLALLLAAIGTVILMRRVSKPADDSKVQAAKFDINEINE